MNSIIKTNFNFTNQISKYSGKIFIGEVDQYGNQYERYFTRDTIFGRTSYVDPIDGSKLCWDQAFTNVSIYSDPLQEVYQDSIVSSAGFIISDAYLDTLGTRNGVVKIVNSNILKYITTETYYTGEIYKIESSFGFKVKRIKKDSRLYNKDLGGGAILDVGCYPISLISFCL